MRSCSILCLLMSFLPVAFAGSPEWEKSVRAAAKYPNGKACFAVGVNSDGGFMIGGETVTPAGPSPTLEMLLKEHRDAPDDFLKVPPLIYAFEKAGQHDKADEFALKATRMGPDYLKTHPDDVRSMTWLGLMLSQQRRYPEAEGWLKRATQTAPKDARVWRDLAVYYFNRALKIGTGDESIEFDEPMEYLAKLSPDQRQAFRSHLIWAQANGKPEAGEFLAKASDCFDWAVLLAPDRVEPRVFRCNWHQALLMLRNEETVPQNHHTLGNIFTTRNIMPENLSVADAHRAAELSDDPRAIGYAVMVQVLRSPRMVEGAPEDRDAACQAAFRKLQPKLERFRQSSDPEKARNAARIQVMLEYMVFHDYQAAEKILLTMKPDADDTVQDALAMIVYSGMNKSGGLIDLMKQKLARRDDPNRMFLLGKSQIRDNQFDVARKTLREAVRKYPEDQRLAVTLAALLIQQGTAADSPEADRLLSVAEAGFDKRLRELAACSSWDEQTPNLPPMKDRGELCVGCLPEQDQELLRLARLNRVILMGLTGKRGQVMDLLEKWLVFSRPADRPLQDAFELTSEAAPDSLPFTPAQSPLFPSNTMAPPTYPTTTLDTFRPTGVLGSGPSR